MPGSQGADHHTGGVLSSVRGMSLACKLVGGWGKAYARPFFPGPRLRGFLSPSHTYIHVHPEHEVEHMPLLFSHFPFSAPCMTLMPCDDAFYDRGSRYQCGEKTEALSRRETRGRRNRATAARDILPPYSARQILVPALRCTCSPNLAGPHFDMGWQRASKCVLHGRIGQDGSRCEYSTNQVQVLNLVQKSLTENGYSVITTISDHMGSGEGGPLQAWETWDGVPRRWSNQSGVLSRTTALTARGPIRHYFLRPECPSPIGEYHSALCRARKLTGPSHRGNRISRKCRRPASTRSQHECPVLILTCLDSAARF